MLRLFVSIIFATIALTFSATAADLSKKPRPADWSKICENSGRGRPACKADCRQNGNSQACSVYCPDGYHIGNCLVGVSCPFQNC
ncbi:hypothetical protein SAMN05192541_11712 [Bradyrhizobium arachidis]|nr:hypothetical protein SAMN05192541_11712 [Bradyrhizobium arachidis]